MIFILSKLFIESQRKQKCLGISNLYRQMYLNAFTLYITQDIESNKNEFTIILVSLELKQDKIKGV